MRETNFIRQLLDVIDAQHDAAVEAAIASRMPAEEAEEIETLPKAPPVINVTVVAPVESGEETSNGVNPEEVDSPIDHDDIFIPPLQAKIEMMKKLTGVQPKNQNLIVADDDEPLDV